MSEFEWAVLIVLGYIAWGLRRKVDYYYQKTYADILDLNRSVDSIKHTLARIDEHSRNSNFLLTDFFRIYKGKLR